jgi:3-oxoacyl-[acyl-carrier-protein] synthase II
MNDRVVITGSGLVSSLGLSASDTWEALLLGKHGIRRIQDFDATGFNCRVAAQAQGIQPSALGIHPRDVRIMDKHSYMLMKCTHEAFRESRLHSANIPGEDIGFFAGMGMVDHNIDDLVPAVMKSIDSHGSFDFDTFFLQGYREIYPLWPLSMLNNISFCQVAISLGIKGDNSVFSPHADSGAMAIAEAAQTVLDKKANVVLAGGVSEKVSPLSLARAHFFDILNISDPDNEKACRPFGSDRKGTVLGEGCGVIAMELKSTADTRGIPYTVMVTGFGSSFEIGEGSQYPTVKAIAGSMQTALEQAGIYPADIDVIIANGEGSFHGDKNEMDAIHRVFSGSTDRIHVFSSKGALGHLLAGAPAVDLILGMYMLDRGIIPPTLHTESCEKGMEFNLVKNEPLKSSPDRIMINCQSYEGQSASLIIEKVKP